jgi:hypothetical protein
VTWEEPAPLPTANTVKLGKPNKTGAAEATVTFEEELLPVKKAH